MMPKLTILSALILLLPATQALAASEESLERLEAEVLAKYKGADAAAIIQLLGVPKDSTERDGVEFLTWQNSKQTGATVGGVGIQKTAECRATFEFEEKKLSAFSLVGAGSGDRALCMKIIEPLMKAPGAASGPAATPKSARAASPPRSSSSEILTNADVVTLVKAKLSDAVIITKIRSSNCKFDVTTENLTALKEAGVSDAVIQVMIETMKK